MKTILRTTCAILATFVIITSVHAEAPVNTSGSSDLSSISLQINGKTYTGEEVKNRIISNIFAIENTKKTMNEKSLFMRKMGSKVGELQWKYYELPDGENKKNTLKILNAVYPTLFSEVMRLNNEIINEMVRNQPSKRKNYSIQECKAMGIVYGDAGCYREPYTAPVGVGKNVKNGFEEMLARAETQQQSLYVNTLKSLATNGPSIGWKDKETAINYQLNRSSSLYKDYPKTVKAIIVQAVNDYFAGRIGVQYLDETFKTLF